MSNQVNFPLKTKKIEKGNLSQAAAGHGGFSVVSTQTSAAGHWASDSPSLERASVLEVKSQLLAAQQEPS